MKNARHFRAVPLRSLAMSGRGVSTKAVLDTLCVSGSMGRVDTTLAFRSYLPQRTFSRGTTVRLCSKINQDDIGVWRS